MHASKFENQVRISKLVADYLVNKGTPFRIAYNAVKDLCQYCEDNNSKPSDLSLDEFKKFSKEFEKDALNITAKSSVEARNNPGGTAPNRVKSALGDAKAQVKNNEL